ncbi:hypothetical protein [Jiella avicenniae]|uniref:Uncharacterized protein n=1 Tax=Jiella avicenniae TaxID=2907202 RepID=A0A9X1NVQ2_9HYPH|nr:hypothetical protein [Jiella avicenniae]MCE7026407.1 hypothetical protein [Jiella avicenniae]
MTPPLRVAAIDRFDPSYGTQARFVDALIGEVALTWREAGVKGERLIEADWTDGVLFLLTGADARPLTRAAVRQFLKASQDAKRRGGRKAA